MKKKGIVERASMIIEMDMVTYYSYTFFTNLATKL